MGIAALVRYNPCTVHAREGSPCPYFNGVRRCGFSIGECLMPEYDRWFKDVVEGGMKSFYPYRIGLLEQPGAFLLVYHTHRRAIVGEARITHWSFKDGKYYYWFDEFTVYPKPVPLEMVYSDERLKAKGRWKVIYLRLETLNEIRELAGLTGDLKERPKLAKESARGGTVSKPYRSAVSILRDELERLKGRVDEEVLEKTRELFIKAVSERLTKGRSCRSIFYACLLIALRSCGSPITLRYISNLSSIERRKLFNVYVLLKSRIPIKMLPPKPEDIVKLYAEQIGLTRRELKEVKKYIREFKAKRVRGRSPVSIAATAVYITTRNRGVSQKEIAKTFNVSEVTIRNLAKILTHTL